jgi:hypothetical protein
MTELDIDELEKELAGMIRIPEPVVPEFRLYYDEKGSILFYTCEKPEGDYIVIDAHTYACGRYDIRVKDKQIVYDPRSVIIQTMAESNAGIRCASEDVNIIVDDDYTGNTLKWEIKTHEFRFD